METTPWHRRVGRWGDRRLLRSLPEFTLFPSDEQRAESVERLDKSLEESNAFWLGVVGVVGATVVAVLLVHAVSSRLMTAKPWWATLLINVLGFAVGYAGVVWVWRRCVARRLREELGRLGVAVCLQCGYSLREIPESRCPECGRVAIGRVAELVRGDTLNSDDEGLER